MDTLKLKDNSFSHSILGYASDYQKSNIFTWDRVINNDNDVFVCTDQRISEYGNNSFAWIIEPIDISPSVYDSIKLYDTKYKKVFTHEKTLIENGHPYEFVPFGCCWIRPEDHVIYPKTKLVSMISSNKNMTSGHSLRHEVVNNFKEKLDVFGRAYNPIDYKLTGLKDYRYSVVIENTKRDYWFTEKLIDCLVTGTIPIYWGCPSIGNFFDINGFIIFNDIKELKDILDNLTEEDYHKRMDSIVNNFNEAKNYLLPDEWVYKKINNIL
jgi:hypothetical protein